MVPRLLAAALVALLATSASGASAAQRGFPVRPVTVQLGVRVVETTEQLREALGVEAAQAALVMDVDLEGPAGRSGIRAGDVLTQVAGKPVADGGDVMDALEGRKPGDEVTVDYVRKGAPATVHLTLAAASGRMRMGRWGFDVPGFPLAEQFRGELRRFHDEMQRQLRDLDRRLRRLEDEAPSRTHGGPAAGDQPACDAASASTSR